MQKNLNLVILIASVLLFTLPSCGNEDDEQAFLPANRVFNFGLEIRTYPYGYVSDTVQTLIDGSGRVFGYQHTVLLTSNEVGGGAELSGMTQVIALRLRTTTPEFPETMRADLVDPLLDSGRLVCEILDDVDFDLGTTRGSRVLQTGFVRYTTDREGRIRIIINGSSGLSGINGTWEGLLQPARFDF